MRVCFTGHRKISPDDVTSLLEALTSLIRQLSEREEITFLAGGAVGFDTLAALCVLNERESNKNIRLELILPCKNQTEKWRDSDIEKYNFILDCADRSSYVCEHYTPYCMMQRNRALVDGADLCVAYLRESKGGTAYTVDYARSRGVQVINLALGEKI